MKASSATFTVVKTSPIKFGATAAVGGRYSALRTNPTDRQGETRLREPACGALFQPYGAVELSGTVSLIANLALETALGPRTESTHRMRIGSTAFVEENGGTWNGELLSRLGVGGRDNLRLCADWNRNEGCGFCGRGQQ